MLRTWSLYQKLGAVFAALLLACCGASFWLQMRSSVAQQDEVTQRLSLGLASHIAGTSELMQGGSLNAPAVKDLFGKLMAVNPSMEVYLLSPEGRILAHDAPAGHLKADRVDLAPVHRLLAGDPLPVLGDDPRNPARRKVFSAAPLQIAGQPAGYVYVVLFGEERERLDADSSSRRVLNSALWSMGLVALLALAAGLAAFRLITRPLKVLTGAVREVRTRGLANLQQAAPLLAQVKGGGGEIDELQQAFLEMTQRLAEQWRQLTAQEQQRRELFANVSHDLRTPLTSLHGYLETLLVKADGLSEADRRRYLLIALDQSSKVGRLAQELFDLARLEYGVVEPEMETFAMPDLLQDVFQKFELASQGRHQRLVADIPASVPAITADVGLMERVLTNLLDNAIRHTPEGGEVKVRMCAQSQRVRVDVSDTGPGIPPALAERLFVRPMFSTAGGRAGGLGLVIVRRILQLHGSDIVLARSDSQGSVFSFELPAAPG
ncbi:MULTISPECIES: ATP-binding protein [Ramlibacter]|uniref:histidine kinase n=1 Tax=Ramlibacter aquaticus TaxID=2780094 RepID=A0ABR9SF79_9BURK|nr:MULTISPECIES: ATP-binding protein [Ramlibacter]MBE7940951.1 HAMP domain-containing protein [Ramlibacter aquaticus]